MTARHQEQDRREHLVEAAEDGVHVHRQRVEALREGEAAEDVDEAAGGRDGAEQLHPGVRRLDLAAAHLLHADDAFVIRRDHDRAPAAGPGISRARSVREDANATGVEHGLLLVGRQADRKVEPQRQGHAVLEEGAERLAGRAPRFVRPRLKLGRIRPIYRAFGFAGTAYLNLGLLAASLWLSVT